LPIITTDAVGCREVVDDGHNGFLCKVRDAGDLAEKMERMLSLTHELFAYHVHDPERYGVVAFDAQQRAISIEEKPQQPRDHGRGYAWLDTGTHDSLLDAASFISTLQKRQSLQVCCPEEIAFAQKWIDAAQIQKLVAPLAKNGYGQYLLGLIK
jgi:glucose-1-phosphate thymidylyltransferase